MEWRIKTEFIRIFRNHPVIENIDDITSPFQADGFTSLPTGMK